MAVAKSAARKKTIDITELQSMLGLHQTPFERERADKVIRGRIFFDDQLVISPSSRL